MSKVTVFVVTLSFLLPIFSGQANYKPSRELQNRITSSLSAKELSLQGVILSDEDLDWIVQSYPDVRRLDLTDQTAISSHSARQLARLKNLSLLILCRTKLEPALDSFLKERNRALKIRRLDLFSSPEAIQEEIVSYLNRFVHTAVSREFHNLLMSQGDYKVEYMKKVTLRDQLSSFRLSNLDGSRGLGRLEKLDLMAVWLTVTDEDVAWIVVHFPLLKSLRLPANHKLTASGIEVLSKLTQLKSLRITMEDHAEEFCHFVASKMSHLTELEVIDHGGVTDRSLRSLGQLQGLTSLELWGDNITGAGLAHLSKSVHLKALKLKHSTIPEVGLRHLSGLTELSLLEIPNIDLTDRGVDYLSEMFRLASLEIAGDGITDEGLERISRLSDLEYLNLRSSKITDAGLRHLKRLQNLKEIKLEADQITDEGLSMALED